MIPSYWKQEKDIPRDLYDPRAYAFRWNKYNLRCGHSEIRSERNEEDEILCCTSTHQPARLLYERNARAGVDQ